MLLSCTDLCRKGSFTNHRNVSVLELSCIVFPLLFNVSFLYTSDTFGDIFFCIPVVNTVVGGNRVLL